MRFLTLLTLAFLLSSTSCYRRTIDEAYLNLLTDRLERAGHDIDTIIYNCEQGMIDGYYFSGRATANYMYFIKHVNQTGDLSISDFHINQLDQEALLDLDISADFDSLGKVWQTSDTNNFSYKLSSIFNEIESAEDLSPTVVTTTILSHVDPKDFQSPLYKLLFFKFLIGAINTEKGIEVLLPPYPDSSAPKTALNPDVVFEIMVGANNQIIVAGKNVEIGELTNLTKAYLSGGSTPTSQKIVSLKNQKGTSVTQYVKVYNEIIRAYNELRNELSKSKFNTSFDDLDQPQQKEIRKLVPMRISEAEPIAD